MFIFILSNSFVSLGLFFLLCCSFQCYFLFLFFLHIFYLPDICLQKRYIGRGKIINVVIFWDKACVTVKASLFTWGQSVQPFQSKNQSKTEKPKGETSDNEQVKHNLAEVAQSLRLLRKLTISCIRVKLGLFAMLIFLQKKKK